MSNTVVDSLLSKIDLVELAREYTDLKQVSNNDWRGCCPIHKGNNPTSFCVFETQEGQMMYYCHSCGSFGSAITFYSEVEGLPFFAAVEKLAESCNINLADNQTYQTQRNLVRDNTITRDRFVKQVFKVEEFLKQKRGLSEEIIREFELGFDESGTLFPTIAKSKFPGIVIPIHDIYRRIVGFSKRRTGSGTGAKYINSLDSEVFKKGELFFNLNRIAKKIKDDKKIYLCEGYFDCMSAHQQGLNCVAYIGGAITKSQIALMRSLETLHKGITFILASDNDPTGEKEIIALREKIKKYNMNLNLRVYSFPQEEFEFPNGEIRRVKDFNDMHVLGLNIADYPHEHIDLCALRKTLDKCGDIESEYREVELFMPSVKNPMIRSDIAKMLSKRWKREDELQEIKQWINATGDSQVDEILSEFATVGECIDKFLLTANEETNGIGYETIDFSFGGLRKKEVVLIGAYSKTGKTDFLCEIVLHSILRLHMNCVVFSMEMAREAFIERMLIKLFNTTMYGLKDMMMSSSGATYITDAREKLEKYLLIIDTNNLTLTDVKRRIELANLYKFEKPVDRVFVDYFQYLQGTSEYAGIAETAKGMKPLAKSMNIEFFMLSQFNRESKPWDEPSIASFKGGNDLESSFDKALLLWRPSNKVGLSEIDREKIKYQTMVKIISRNGLRGEDIFEMKYNPETSRLQEVIF